MSFSLPGPLKVPQPDDEQVWAFWKQATLVPLQDFPQEQVFVYGSFGSPHFLLSHLLPHSVFLLRRGGGKGREGLLDGLGRGH